MATTTTKCDSQVFKDWSEKVDNILSRPTEN